MKIVGICILVFAQVVLAAKWVVETAWHYAIVKPWRHYQQLRDDAQEWRDHVCYTDPMADAPGRTPYKVWQGVPTATGRHSA